MFKKSTSNFFNILIFVFCLFSPDSSQAQFSQLKDLFFGLEPSIEVPLDALNELGDDSRWIKPSIGYEFQFANYPGDPSQFLMRETLRFRLSLPLSMQNSTSISLGPQMVGEFIRPFDKYDFPSWKELKPYGPHRAPHSHNSALNLKPGDFYSFTTELAFKIGASTAQLKGFAFMGLDANYVVSGDFKVAVYRLSGSRVKVVASSLRQKSIGFGAHISSVPDIDVFGFDLGNQIINNQLSVRIMDWNIYKKEKGNLFSVSYTYDLNTPEGVDSYNQLMNLTQWKNVDLNVKNINGRTQNGVRNFWISDLSLSRQYALENAPGVIQNNESELDYVTRSQGIEFDIRLAGSNNQRYYMESDYQLRQSPHSPLSRYRIATLSLNRDYHFAFNFREKEVEKKATMVMSLDENFQIKGVDELSFRYERTDKKLKVETGIFGQNELPELYGQMRKMLPESLHYPYVYLLEDYLKSGYNKGTYVSMDLIFNPMSFEVLQSLSPSEINLVFDQFLAAVIEKLKSNNNIEKRFYGNLELTNSLLQHINNNDGTVESYFSEKKMGQLKRILHYVFQRPTGQEMIAKQWEYFRSLKNSLIFRDLGVGVLVRLLERAGDKNRILFRDLLKFEVTYKTDGQDRIVFGVGEYVRPEYTGALLRDQDRVLNRRYDPWHFIEP